MIERSIVKLQTGDVLLLPIYYYSQPYKSLAEIVDFGVDFVLDTVKNALEKLVGEKAANMIMQIIPPEMDSEKITLAIVKKVLAITDVKYVHQEMYLQNGWVLSAQLNGVKLIKYKSTAIQNFDVARFEGIDKEKVLESVYKYWNLPYDYAGKAISTLTDFLSLPFKKLFGIEDLEGSVEGFLEYEDNSAFQSGSLCAKILKDAGVNIDKVKYVSPDDLSKIDGVRIIV